MRPCCCGGEPGVGKEHAARQLHALSPRRERPFVAVRCFGLTAPALYRVLYDSAPAGDEDSNGAASVGALRQARGGTLLLDGVETLDEAAQRGLLLALLALRPASPSPRRLPPPRLATSTTEDLLTQVRRGEFRRDLYHRLAVVRIHVPPLRQRRDDILALVDELQAEHAASGLPSFTLAPDAQEALRAYRWPGNVRELQNTILRMLALTAEPQLGAHLLSPRILQAPPDPGHADLAEVGFAGTLQDRVEALEARVLKETLIRLRWNKTRAANELGLSRVGLRAKLVRYGLDSDGGDHGAGSGE